MDPDMAPGKKICFTVFAHLSQDELSLSAALVRSVIKHHINITSEWKPMKVT